MNIVDNLNRHGIKVSGEFLSKGTKDERPRFKNILNPCVEGILKLLGK